MDEQDLEKIGFAPPGWKTAEEIMRHLVMTRFKNLLLQDLKNETDPNMALRKALLGLIFLATEVEVAQDLAQEILADFGPLLEGFNANTEGQMHPLIGDQQCIRWRDPQGRFELLLKEEFYDRLISDINERLKRVDESSDET